MLTYESNFVSLKSLTIFDLHFIYGFTDWTQALCKFLREQLSKLNENSGKDKLPDYISISGSVVGLGVICQMVSSSTTGTTATVSRDVLEQQLKYISNLAHHLFNEVSLNLKFKIYHLTINL